MTSSTKNIQTFISHLKFQTIPIKERFVYLHFQICMPKSLNLEGIVTNSHEWKTTKDNFFFVMFTVGHLAQNASFILLILLHKHNNFLIGTSLARSFSNKQKTTINENKNAFCKGKIKNHKLTRVKYIVSIFNINCIWFMNIQQYSLHKELNKVTGGHLYNFLIFLNGPMIINFWPTKL